MRTLLFTLFALASAYSQAGVQISQTYWYVQLSCQNNPQCFASSNGAYTSNQSAARRFDDPTKAQRFVDSFTSNMRDKSPRISQGTDNLCISDDEARRLNLSGPSCTP